LNIHNGDEPPENSTLSFSHVSQVEIVLVQIWRSCLFLYNQNHSFTKLWIISLSCWKSTTGSLQWDWR